jgi:hypothetical protein
MSKIHMFQNLKLVNLITKISDLSSRQDCIQVTNKTRTPKKDYKKNIKTITSKFNSFIYKKTCTT